MKRDGKYILIILAVWFLFAASLNFLRRQTRPVSGQTVSQGGGKKKTAGSPECLALKVWYDGYNTEYFFGALPKDTNVDYGDPGVDSEGGERMGVTRKSNGHFEIILNKKYTLAPKVAHELILHESCHIIAWTEFDEHGPRWRDCMDRLYQAGAFEGLL